MNANRRFFAIFLLIVMLVQMGFKTLHQHHYEPTAKISCSDCENHRAHGGHLVDWDGDSDDCELCQFLQCPYTPAQEIIISYTPVLFFIKSITTVPDIQDSAWCIIAPRGPPSYLL